MHTGKEPSRGQQPRAHESGNAATGHPANSVVTPHGTQRDSTGDAAIAPGGKLRGTNYMQRDDVPQGGGHGNAVCGHEAGTRGSGTPVESGAGQLADDRPGRDAPKGS
jgi:hypothetical protein